MLQIFITNSQTMTINTIFKTAANSINNSQNQSVLLCCMKSVTVGNTVRTRKPTAPIIYIIVQQPNNYPRYIFLVFHTIPSKSVIHWTDVSL